MRLQLPCLNLLWIVAFFDCSLIPFAKSRFVTCYLGNEVGELCSCSKLQMTDTPWPEDDEHVAPKPCNASLRMGKYNGKLFPQIKWTVNREDAEFVNGFYLEVFLEPNFYSYYHCSHNGSTILKKFPDKFITYKFEGCCRMLQSGFIVNDELHVTIFSLPMYGVDDVPAYASASLTVEDDEVPSRETASSLQYFKEMKRIHNNLKRTAEKNLSTPSIHGPKAALSDSLPSQNIRKKDD